jgi:hypothetical protein
MRKELALVGLILALPGCSSSASPASVGSAPTTAITATASRAATTTAESVPFTGTIKGMYGTGTIAGVPGKPGYCDTRPASSGTKPTLYAAEDVVVGNVASTLGLAVPLTQQRHFTQDDEAVSFSLLPKDTKVAGSSAGTVDVSADGKTGDAKFTTIFYVLKQQSSPGHPLQVGAKLGSATVSVHFSCP